MLNARLAEIARQPNAPFSRHRPATIRSAGRSRRSSCPRACRMAATARGLNALAQELARVRQHGFGEAELGRAKALDDGALRAAYNERDKSESPDLADELVRHFLIAEGAPGHRGGGRAREAIPAERSRLPRWRLMAREYITEENRVVLSTAPEKAGPGAGVGNRARRCAAYRPVRVGRAVEGRDCRPRAADEGADARAR